MIRATRICFSFPLPFGKGTKGKGLAMSSPLPGPLPKGEGDKNLRLPISKTGVALPARIQILRKVITAFSNLGEGDIYLPIPSRFA